MSLLPAESKTSLSAHGPLPDLGVEPPWQTGLPRELVTGCGCRHHELQGIETSRAGSSGLARSIPQVMKLPDRYWTVHLIADQLRMARQSDG